MTITRLSLTKLISSFECEFLLFSSNFLSLSATVPSLSIFAAADAFFIVIGCYVDKDDVYLKSVPCFSL